MRRKIIAGLLGVAVLAAAGAVIALSSPAGSDPLRSILPVTKPDYQVYQLVSYIPAYGTTLTHGRQRAVPEMHVKRSIPPEYVGAVRQALERELLLRDGWASSHKPNATKYERGQDGNREVVEVYYGQKGREWVMYTKELDSRETLRARLVSLPSGGLQRSEGISDWWFADSEPGVASIRSRPTQLGSKVSF